MATVNVSDSNDNPRIEVYRERTLEDGVVEIRVEYE